jgi:hypothetical protein
MQPKLQQVRKDHPICLIHLSDVTPLAAIPTGGAANPWAADCPVPTTFFVNDFSYNNNTVMMTVSYNNGTFLCPNTAANSITYNGIYDMYCDDDGLVRVLTDGFSWLWISQWSWCGVMSVLNPL